MPGLLRSKKHILFWLLMVLGVAVYKLVLKDYLSNVQNTRIQIKRGHFESAKFQVTSATTEQETAHDQNYDAPGKEDAQGFTGTDSLPHLRDVEAELPASEGEKPDLAALTPHPITYDDEHLETEAFWDTFAEGEGNRKNESSKTASRSEQNRIGNSKDDTKSKNDPVKEAERDFEMKTKENILAPENKTLGTLHENGASSAIASVFARKPMIQEEFPPYTICPYLGIRKTKGKDFDMSNFGYEKNEVCKPQQVSESACKQAYVSYKIDQPALQCDEERAKQICNVSATGVIKCDVSPCGENPVFIAGIDPVYGTFEEKTKWRKFRTADHLELYLSDFIQTNIETGLNFCILKCKTTKHGPPIEQLLIFPPFLYLEADHDARTRSPLININIVMLDSLSRTHFYRSLPKTVALFRDIVHNKSIDATVLDYELFQSMADYTFHNIRALMAGKTDFHYKEHTQQHYEIEYLFQRLKDLGYYTMLQEDSCWYDEWGSLFTDNLFQGAKPQTQAEFQSRWATFQSKVWHYKIDDFGLSHFSCEALQRYNITNQFNRPKRICFGGRVLGEYFLDYAEKLFRDQSNAGDNGSGPRPIFAYTHLNTGHETTGTRIKQLDSRLAAFLEHMAQNQNTLTLIFSDHGPKTTNYAFETMEGRAEIYDALLFVILPKKVAILLGEARTKALFANQDRLLSTLDLHNAMLSLGESTRVGNSEGIFSEVSRNRTCLDILMKSAAVCKCEGWDERFPSNYPHFAWLAELALGTLNNRIQEEYLQSPDAVGGYGNCHRLIGKSFEKVRRRTIGDKYLVTMDLIVRPEKEIFEVQVEYSKTAVPGDTFNVSVTHLSRISIYRRFDRCKDSSVNLTICVCNSKRKSTPELKKYWITIKTRKDLLRIVSRARSFDSKLEITDLHDKCLIMVTRAHEHRTAVFEIVNACADRSYQVTIMGQSKSSAIVTRTLPFKMRIHPLTINFLFSVYHLTRPYGFKVRTSYKAHFL